MWASLTSRTASASEPCFFGLCGGLGVQTGAGRSGAGSRRRGLHPGVSGLRRPERSGLPLCAEAYLTASWGWTALWKRAATATLSSWGGRWGPERVRKMAVALGFGKGQDIADGLGQLPFRSEAETFENEGQLPILLRRQGASGDALTGGRDDEHHCGGGVYHTRFRGVPWTRRRAKSSRRWHALVPAGVRE